MATQPAGLPENITLRIVILAHGNRAEDDLFLVLGLDTTIAQLKQRIQESVSQHPVPENQRLIYHGRPLLDGTVPLRQVLRVDQRTASASHVIHLVIRDPTTDARPPAVLAPQQALPAQSTPRAMPLGPNAHMAIHNQLHNMQHQIHHAQALRASQARLQTQNAIQQTTQALSNHARAAGLPPPNIPPTIPNTPANLGPHMQQPPTTAVTRIEERIGPNGEHIRAVIDSNGNSSSTTMTFRIQGLTAPEPPDRPSSAPGSSPLTHNDPANRAGNPIPQNIHVRAQLPPHMPAGFPFPPGMQLPPPLPSIFLPTMQPMLPPPPPPTMAWLLNSPHGPQGIVFAPGHGFFNTLPSQPLHQTAALPPTPTPTIPITSRQSTPTLNPQIPPQGGSTESRETNSPAPPQPGAVPQPQPPRPAPAVPLQRLRRELFQDNNILGFIETRIWLFMRLYIFMLVLSESGTWRRLILLTCSILYCLLPRNNPLTAAFEIVRRHFDNLIGPPTIPERQPQQPGQIQPQVQQQASANAQGTQSDQQGSTGAGTSSRGAPMPTPEQAARRLLDQQNRRNPNPVLHLLHRIEQGVVLFLASLIPGLGERHVQAREQARRILEEEERRLREESESQDQAGSILPQTTSDVSNAENDHKNEAGPLPESWSTGDVNASSSGVDRHAGAEGEVRSRGTGS